MLVTLLAVALGLAQQGWFVFEPDSKGFRVELPGPPDSTTSRTLNRATGRSQLTRAELRTPQATYLVVVTENPGGVIRDGHGSRWQEEGAEDVGPVPTPRRKYHHRR